MRKNLLGIFLLAFIVFTACARQKKTSATKNTVTYLQMHRTSCFGRCPTYNIEIYSDGLVRYTGIRFVADSGVYEKNISATKAKELLAKFAAFKVDTLKDKYPMMIADIPGIVYIFEYKKKKRTIQNAHFGPKFLQGYANTIDAAIKVDESWMKISEGYKGD